MSAPIFFQFFEFTYVFNKRKVCSLVGYGSLKFTFLYSLN